jgi:hypothetical protein
MASQNLLCIPHRNARVDRQPLVKIKMFDEFIAPDEARTDFGIDEARDPMSPEVIDMNLELDRRTVGDTIGHYWFLRLLRAAASRDPTYLATLPERADWQPHEL